jgi:hypothetical protein
MKNMITTRKMVKLNVLVSKRFVVNVKGRNVTMDQIKETLSDLDLDKLADMK